MRILYIHQYFRTPEMPGGTRSYELARCLISHGHEVEMITSRQNPSGEGSSRWTVSAHDGIRVHWFPVPYGNEMSYRRRIKAFAAFAWASARRAEVVGGDVVFASSTPLTVAIPAIYAARRNHIPMVFEVRDLWPEVPIAMGALRTPFSRGAARWLERQAYRNAAWIVALSPAMKEGIVRAGYPDSRVTVIPNACDVSLFDVPPEAGEELRRQHPWLAGRRLVIYTGTLGMANGVSYLVRLAAEVQRRDPSIVFVVIGKGKEAPLVRQAAASLGVLDRNFYLLPPHPKRAMPAWFSAADLVTSMFIDIPELWANSANKVFDGLAAGRPLAINHEGWIADLLRETGAGLVLAAHDIPAAATALIRALRDDAWVTRARASAHDLARGRFNRQHLGAELEQVLHQVVQAGLRAPEALIATGAASH